MTIEFKNGKTLEADICGTDIHQNLIIELETDDYNSVKDILLDENATAEITADGNTYYDYTRVKYLNSSIADSGKTKIKSALVYGKDVYIYNKYEGAKCIVAPDSIALRLEESEYADDAE